MALGANDRASQAPEIAMVAGEPSGDLIAGLLLKALRSHMPDAAFSGIGGPCMQAQGFRIRTPMQALSVHGFLDALIHYREIKTIRDNYKRQLLIESPPVFIGTDAPDFNLGLELDLRRAGIPTVHFVSPSIWAWRGGRIKTIARAVDLMLCLFPFEQEIYERAGVSAEFVGHPLADVIPMTPDPASARTRLGLSKERQWLTLMPGSREGEMRRIGPVFIEAAVELARQDRELGFIAPMATLALHAQFEALVRTHDPDHALHDRLQIFDGRSHDAIEACDAVLVASGTATLECALFKKPMVIGYRVGTFNYLLMKRLAYLPWIGLPNILLREFVVPELVQSECTPKALASALRLALDDGLNRANLTARFASLHQSLKCNTGESAAKAIVALLASRKGAQS
jgi:lipid-A-disaccharide synthase